MIIFFYLPTYKIFTSNVYRSFSAHDNANETSSPELKNIPNWIVVLAELHDKSIKLECDEGINHTTIDFV